MQAKLDAAKCKLQVLISHWRDEWKDAINKWSEKITIVKMDEPTMKYDRVQLPTEYGNPYILVQCDREALLPTKDYDSTQVESLGGAINYYRHYAFNHLKGVPINLAVNIYSHFLVAFGGTFLVDNYGYNITYEQWFYIDEENKRHREVIRKCLPQATSMTSVAVYDGWVMRILQGIRLDCKLQPKSYIRELTTSLAAHQVGRMIECHFQFYYKSEKMIQIAKRFTKQLRDQGGGGIYVVEAGAYLPLLFPIVNDDINSVENKGWRELRNSFNLEDKDCKKHNWRVASQL